MSRPYRLAVLTSHPIQYQAPFFRALAAHPQVDLTVYFCSRFGLEPFFDPGFDTRFSWDVPLLEGYRHVFLSNWSMRPRVSRFWGVVNPGIITALRPSNTDAVLVYGWARATYWLGFVAATASGIPILLRGDSNLLAEPRGAKAAIKRVVLSTLFKRARVCLTAGLLNHRFYERYGAASSKTICAPFSVDNSFFQSQAARLPSKRDLRTAARVPQGATVFLFCGKLTPAKRPFDVLEALAALPYRDDVYLVYAGEGELRNALETRITSLGLTNVRITGFVNQMELPRWYALSDVLVLPSGFEPWGLVINEAMNFGLPIVASDRVGAAPDLVHDGETGFTYAVGHVQSLTAILARLAADEPLRTTMSDAVRQKIQGWDITETVEGCVAGLREAVGPRKET